MTEKNPLISIVTPLYNSELFIEDTIKTVLSQTYTNWEWIIIDDGSTDNGIDAIRDLQIKDGRINFIANNHNQGAAKARNIGIKASSGSYLCFLDADDIWTPNKLEFQLAFMIKTKSLFSFTGYEFADADGNGNGKIVQVPKYINYRQSLKNTTIWTSTVMLNMNTLTKSQVYMPNVQRGQDTATWWKILKRVDHADGINTTLSFYRRTKTSLSSNKLLALKRTWNLYRNVEKLSYFYSIYNFVWYVYNAIRRRS